MRKISHDPAKFHVGLKVLLINDKGKFLLLKAISKSKAWHGTWDLPGGRINNDEIEIGFHKIVDREIKEEAGDIKYELRPDPVSLAKCAYPGDGERFFILFEAKYISGDVKTSNEHDGYEWKKIGPKDIDKNFNQVIRELMLNYFKWNRV